jgi:Kef-type K+ transport system membrane component KefB
MARWREAVWLIVCVVAFVAVNGYLLGAGKLKANWDGFGLIVAVGLTLAMYSFLYRDNPVFKIAENLFVGVSLGYTLVTAWFEILKPDVYEPLIKPCFVRAGEKGPEFWLLVPTALGLLMWTRFTPRLAWLSRWAFAFVVGLGAGVGIPRTVSSFILKQVEPSLTPLFAAGQPWDVSLNLALILVGVVSVLMYFFFSVEHRGPVKALSKVGIWFLMVSFGASFGYTVMARMSLLIGRMQFLLHDWLGLI